MKFIKKKEILIGSCRFDIEWDETHDAGSFSIGDEVITIGCRSMKTNPEYTFMVLMHEISEICHHVLRLRYDDRSVEGNFKFFMDHKEFEAHNNLLSASIIKFFPK